MKNKSRLVLSLLPLLAVSILFSCSDPETDGYEKTETGLLYKFHVHGTDTLHPKFGDMVRVRIAQYLGDSMLSNSDQVNPEGMREMLREPIFKGAIEEGVRMMVIGDSATFLIKTDSINKYYIKDSTRWVKPNAYMIFGLKLTNIQSVQDVMWEEDQKRKAFIAERKESEPKEIAQYVEGNHIDVKPTKSGLYVIEGTKGNGPMPHDGDVATVHYTGSFLNGTVFGSSMKSNQPLEFVVGAVGPNSVIPGWNEAVKMMKKGSTITVIIPSSLAYDSTGRTDQQSGRYVIPPYAPLKFDMQLIDVKSKK